MGDNMNSTKTKRKMPLRTSKIQKPVIINENPKQRRLMVQKEKIIVKVNKRMRSVRKKAPHKQRCKVIPLSPSQESVTFVKTISPKMMYGSVIDLTQSKSDLNVLPNKRVRREKNRKLNNKYTSNTSSEQFQSTSLITIQPIRLRSASSEDFGLLRHQDNNINTSSMIINENSGNDVECFLETAETASEQLDSSFSSIQLKRTYPFTSVTEIECNKKECTDVDKNDSSNFQELFFIDNVVQQLHGDNLGSLAIGNSDENISGVEISAFMQIYQVNSCDNFENLDV